MAHALTELDDFTSPITVPDGTDSRNNAAEVVEALAQALANRTKAINEHVAWFDVANVFTEGNTFEDNILAKAGVGVDSASANSPGLTMFTSADADPNSGNRWKTVVQALLGGGNSDTMMFSGIPSEQAQLLFSINARWEPVTQRWIQQDPSLPSSAFMLTWSGRIQVCFVTVGASPWATWPLSNSTELRVGNVTATEDINAADDVIAGDDVVAGGDVSATGLVTGTAGLVSGNDITLPAGKHVKYGVPATIFRRVRLSAGINDNTVLGAVFDGEKWKSSATAYVVTIPLPSLPSLSEISQVWLRYTATGAPGTFELVRTLISDWGVSPSGATPTETVLASGTLTTTGSGVKTVAPTLTPEVVANGSYDYSLRITGDPAATHELLGAAISFKPSSPCSID